VICSARTSDRKPLCEILTDLGKKLDAVVSFVVDEDVVVARMLARGREDDKESVIRNRLQVYRDETAPLLEYYKDHGRLVTVDADGDVDDVNRTVIDAIEGPEDK
jgi:adenylate kinase